MTLNILPRLCLRSANINGTLQRDATEMLQRHHAARSLGSLARQATSVRSTRRFATANDYPDLYDAVVLGGGPNGLGLAAALRQATPRLRIAVIESQDLAKTAKQLEPYNSTTWSNRCSSLTPASVRFLKSIGAWQHVDQSRVQPYTRMNVWDGITGGRLTFDWLNTHGLPFLTDNTGDSLVKRIHPHEGNTIAYMIENINLTQALLARLYEQKDDGLRFISPTRVEDIRLGADTDTADFSSWPVLQLSSGESITARLLIGADGPNSMVRTFAGIDSKGWDYERHGVVASLRLADGHASQPTAYQRFLPTGPAALLPMPNGYASLVWSTTPERAALLKSLGEEDFVALVNAAFRLSPVDIEYMHSIQSGQKAELDWRVQHTPIDQALVPRLVAGAQAGSVASFPLKLRHADAYTGERVALVGDAAHTVHPLAGQGLNLGLADARSLAGVISSGVEVGADIGSTLSLEPYAAERYAANHVMLGVCDKLHKIYSWSSGPVVWARTAGVGVLEHWGWLKGKVMQAARG